MRVDTFSHPTPHTRYHHTPATTRTRTLPCTLHLYRHPPATHAIPHAAACLYYHYTLLPTYCHLPTHHTTYTFTAHTTHHTPHTHTRTCTHYYAPHTHTCSCSRARQPGAHRLPAFPMYWTCCSASSSAQHSFFGFLQKTRAEEACELAKQPFWPPRQACRIALALSGASLSPLVLLMCMAPTRGQALTYATFTADVAQWRARAGNVGRGRGFALRHRISRCACCA